jgi:hypothetical protein
MHTSELHAWIIFVHIPCIIWKTHLRDPRYIYHLKWLLFCSHKNISSSCLRRASSSWTFFVCVVNVDLEQQQKEKRCSDLLLFHSEWKRTCDNNEVKTINGPSPPRFFHPNCENKSRYTHRTFVLMMINASCAYAHSHERPEKLGRCNFLNRRKLYTPKYLH